MIGGYK